MSKRVNEIRDQIYKARSDGHRKESMVVVVDHEYLASLRDELDLISTTKLSDGSIADEIDGVPVITDYMMDEDDMMLVADKSGGSNLSELF